MSTNIGGRVLNPAYQGVEDVFRENFTDGWEPQGAAFAAYVNGDLVVDLWGGYADSSCGWKWREDTMATIFSCTKSLASMVFASFVEKGLLSYSDPVSKYWPEYAQRGKEDTTISHILHHQAGIPYFTDDDGSVTILDADEATNAEGMDRLVEGQRAQFAPGSQTSYHALTFGYLLDGICRRVDPKGRNIGEYFQQEIANKHKLDVHIGKTENVENRIARIYRIGELYSNIAKELYNKPDIVYGMHYILPPWSNTNRALQNFSGVANDFHMYNNPEMRKIGMPSVNGVGTARDLARTMDLFMRGEIVSKTFVEKNLVNPVLVNKFDSTLGIYMSKGHGFMYTRSPTRDWQFGHLGVGGQNVKTDPKKGITFAYLTNGMKIGQGEKTQTMKRLEKALYECYNRQST